MEENAIPTVPQPLPTSQFVRATLEMSNFMYDNGSISLT